MYSRVHPHEENNNDIENNVRLSERRTAIHVIRKNKEYEKYKCNVCKKNEPYYQCPTCKFVVCSECTINNNICKTCHDTKEKEKQKSIDLQSRNLVWFKNATGKYRKWCFCCMNK